VKALMNFIGGILVLFHPVWASEMAEHSETGEIFSVITLTSITSFISEKLDLSNTTSSTMNEINFAAQITDTVLLSSSTSSLDEEATTLSDSAEWSEDEMASPAVPNETPVRKVGGGSFIMPLRIDLINKDNDEVSDYTETRFVEACRLSFPKKAGSWSDSYLATTESLSSSTFTVMGEKTVNLFPSSPHRPLIINRRHGIKLHPKNRTEILQKVPIYITPRFEATKKKGSKILNKNSDKGAEECNFTGVAYKFIYGYFGGYYIDESVPDEHKILEFDVNTKFKIKDYTAYVDLPKIKRAVKKNSLPQIIEKYIYAFSLPQIVWEYFPEFFEAWQDNIFQLHKKSLKRFRKTFRDFLVKDDKSKLFHLKKHSLNNLRDIILSPRSRNGGIVHRPKLLQINALPFSPRPVIPVSNLHDDIFSPRTPMVILPSGIEQSEIHISKHPHTPKMRPKRVSSAKKEDPFTEFNTKLIGYRKFSEDIQEQCHRLKDRINEKISLPIILSWALNSNEIDTDFQYDVKLLCKQPYFKRFLRLPSPYNNDIFENELNAYLPHIIHEENYSEKITNIKQKYYYILCKFYELETVLEIGGGDSISLQFINELVSGLKDLGSLLRKEVLIEE
jgi:hypothetical protein